MILVTGGTGYIGSHTCVELAGSGQDFLIVDNYSNSCSEVLKRMERLTDKPVQFVEGDIRDKCCLEKIFSTYDISAVIHFAGLKAVGESCEKPLLYYDNNLTGTITLCQIMAEHNVKNLIFSSSATVYGDPAQLPITEDMSLSATNPYGRSKLMIEEMLRDLYASDSSWNIALLRYFNPVGAHSSGLMGEDPTGTPNNLMPYVSKVAIGELQELSIFGDDYPTDDGTGVRDYIHVVDLAKGHVKALEKLQTNFGIEAWNLGVGKGYSVLEMVTAFEQITGQRVPYKFVDRRSGDIAACYADSSKAKRDLGWQARLILEDMIKDTWRWQRENPKGYAI